MRRCNGYPQVVKFFVHKGGLRTESFEAVSYRWVIVWHECNVSVWGFPSTLLRE